MIYDPSLSHFDIDMARGAQGELLVRNICEALGNNRGSIEVKCDSWFVHSGRYYVECHCRHKDGVWRPSGILTTRATFWAFVMGRHPGIVIFDTRWLRQAVALAEQDARNRAACDYGENPTRGVYVYEKHLRDSRDKAFDEHQWK